MRLFVLGLLVGLTVQTGTLRSQDTMRRLQWTRSMWTNAPEVIEPWPAYGALDRSGGVHAWWGIGQSISFVPFDMLSVAVARATGRSSTAGDRVQRAVVSATYYPLVTGLCMLAAYWWLTGIGFAVGDATFGALGMLFGSTLLYWTHGGQENSLMLLAGLAASAGAVHWARTGRQACAVLSAIALGYTCLIRPQTFGITGLGVVISLIAFHTDLRQLPRRVVKRGVVASVWIVLGFVLIERWVHYVRFHEWWGLYLGHYQAFNAAHPENPPGWPLGTPFLDGVTAQTWSRFSVFWFEPLLALPLLIWLFRKPVPRPAVVMTIGLLALLLLEVVVYARVSFWYGSNSWGPRYLTGPCEMCAALAVASVAAIWSSLSRAQRLAAGGLIAAAIAVQVSSVLLDDSLELMQQIVGRPIVAQRFINLWHFFSATDVSSLGWRFYPGGSPHITLFPWVGTLYLGSTVGRVTLGAWACLLGASIWLAATLIRTAVATHSRRPDNRRSPART